MNQREIIRKGGYITHIEGINDITFSKGSIEDRHIEKAHFKNGDEIPDSLLQELDSEYVYKLEVE